MKAGGEEDGHEDQSGGNDRRRHLLHGAQCGVLRCHPIFDIEFDRLHDHDGVVDHDSDGEHQPEE